MTRGWINQPSSLQSLHHLHGTRVLYEPDSGAVRIYFLDGPAISMRVASNAISKGWPVLRG